MKWLVAAFLLLSVNVARAEVSSDSGYVVEASFVSTAPVSVIWDVLTDYDNIDQFISMIKESHFDYEEGLLHQKVRARWLFFSKTVDLRLKLVEHPGKSIQFEDVGGQAFRVYQGEWKIGVDGVIKVSYTLVATPKFFIPKSLIRGILNKETKKYISEVQAEINRRSNIWHERKN